MAKTAKVKKRDVSIRSRAARREDPISQDTPSKAIIEETEYKPWLHSAQGAGISKRKKSKQLTRQQKVRHQRGLEKADVNADKLERKVEESKSRGRKVNARRIDWEELNGKLATSITETVPAKKLATRDVVPAKIGQAEVNGVMEDVVVEDDIQPIASTTAVPVAAAPQTFGAPASTVPAEEVDEIT